MATATVPTDEDRRALAELERVEWELERRGIRDPDFGGWQHRNRRAFDWSSPHFDLIHRELDAVTVGETERLLIEVAIRHGKTETLTGYMAYRIELDPSTTILFGSYKERQAHKISRAVRRLVKKRGVRLSKDTDGEWETEDGGGFLAVGAGSGVASVNADLIVIDDPIGSRAEAESAAHRDRVWDWITTDILARATPGTRVIFSMPRWHQDDPSGRMQDQHGDRWRLVSLPGEAVKDDMLGREPGELLWPSHRPREWVEGLRVELGSYGFASAFQCRPTPREGGRFKWAWWQLLDDTPTVPRVIRYWDLAGTSKREGNDPDFSAGTAAGRMADGRTALLHQAAFRKSVAERDAELERIARADRKRWGHAVEWWFERESGVGGKERTEAIVKKIQACGLKVSTEPATGSKELRAEPLESAAEAGNVCLAPDDPDAPWWDAFRLEAGEFPGGAHDDRVDSAAGAFAKVALTPRTDVQGFDWKV